MLELIMETSLLVILVMAVRKIFLGKISYKGIYALWLLVVLRLMIPVNLISTPISMWNVITRSDITEEFNENEAVRGEVSEDETLTNQTETFTNDTKNTASDNSGNSVTKNSQEKNKQKSGNNQENKQEQEELSYEGNVSQSLAKEDLVSQNTEAVKESITENRSIKNNCLYDEKEGLTSRGKKVLHMIWLLGSACLLLIIVVSNVFLYYKLKKSRVLYGKREGIKIYQTENIATPCLYGFLQPSVYIPASLVTSESKEGLQEKLSEEELTQIIAHELVHYKHWDHIWAIIRVLFVSIYWFHPFLWVAAAYSKRDAEFACDESTVHSLGEEKRFCYGETLIKLAGSCSGKAFLYPMTSISNQGKGLEKRIQALSEKKTHSNVILLPLALLMVLVLGVTFSGAVVKQKENVSEKTDKDKYVSDTKKEDINSTTVENKGTKDAELAEWAERYDPSEEIKSIKGMPEEQTVSYEGTVCKYAGEKHNIAKREEMVNAITGYEIVGAFIIVKGHISPDVGYYGIFNTKKEKFEKDITGVNLTYWGEDVKTIVYSNGNVIFDYDGNKIASCDLKESEYIRSMTFVNKSKLKLNIGNVKNEKTRTKNISIKK